LPTLFFDVISLLYILNSVRTIARLRRNWRAFWDEFVTPADLALANQLAFFVFIPVGVFWHELGHALATWSVGGQVVSFQWRVFWGYVVSEGSFTAVQDWWIALSGNLVSVLFGLLPLLFIQRVPRRIQGELLYAFSKQQLFYALVWYPAITFLGLAGDWKTIYDFSIAPYAQLTLALHLALLFGLWRLDRSVVAVRWRMARHPETRFRLKELEAAAEANPADARAQANLAYFFHSVGERSLSRYHEQEAQRLDPEESQMNVISAMMAYDRKNYRQAQEKAKAALSTDLPREVRLRMIQVLAYSLMQEGHREEALTQFDVALALAPESSQLYYWRAILKRSMGRREEARLDLEQAVRLAPDEASREQARRELEGT
jgi:tetratricopeptide (TPR) repeat protein